MERLTKREEDIMRVFWNAERPLSAREITTLNSELSQNTVQVLLKKLVKKEFVVEDGISHSGSSIIRQYKSIISEESYFWNLLPQKSFKKAVMNFISDQSSADELKEMEVLLKKKINELSGKED